MTTLKLETEALKFPKGEKPLAKYATHIANMFSANSLKLDEFFSHKISSFSRVLLISFIHMYL